MAIIESTISDSENVDLAHDESVTLALEQNLSTIDLKVKEARGSSIVETITKMSIEDHQAVVEGLKRAMGDKLSAEDLLTVSRILSASSSS